MRHFSRLPYIFMAVLVLLVLEFPIVIAAENCSLVLMEERPLPDDFQLTIHTVPTEHTFFDQAVAQEDGMFAVRTRFTEGNHDAFTQVYVDVFEADGSFWKEISFSTQFEVTIELRNNSLNLLFYDYVIMIDTVTETTKCFTIAPNALRESGLYSLLHRERFTCGEWEYQCRKSIWGYTELVRQSGEHNQTLISYPGMESYVAEITGKVVLTFVALAAVVMFVKKHRAKNIE